MNQLIFMVAMTLIGTFGVFVAPICGVAVYYLFAVLRPQAIWQWALPSEVTWSFFVAIGAIVGAGLTLAGFDSAGVPERALLPHSSRKTWGSVHIAMLSFAVWTGVTYLTAQNQQAAWPWVVEYLKIFTMFFVASIVIKTLRQVWSLMIIAALALGYLSYEVNFLYLVNGYLGIYHNGYGGLDNNGAGLMLAMGLPLCLFAWVGTVQWWRWIFALLIPVILHAVLMTYSRGAMVALLVASPLMFLRGKNRLQLAAAAVAIALIVPTLAGQQIRDRFFSVSEYSDDGSAQSRLASWRAAYDIALDYPIFGVGVRNANLLSNAYGADEEGRAIHSQFLQTVADQGFPGLTLYLMIFVFAAKSLRTVRQMAKHLPSDEARTAYATACAIESSLVVFCVGALFLSLEVFELPYLLLLLAAQLPRVCGLCAPKEQRSSDSQSAHLGSPVAEWNAPRSVAASSN